MGKWGSKKFSIIFIGCLLCMLLLFYNLFQITLAWLYNSDSEQNIDSSKLAIVDNEDSSITSSSETFEFTLGAAYSTLNLSNVIKIKNTGNTETLLRVFYSIYTDEAKKLIATTRDLAGVAINNGFVASDENIDNVYSGHFYYNSALLANDAVTFINSISPTSELANKTIKIKLIAEFVNYQGGPYQLGQDLPWKNTPPKWAFNYNSLTKAERSVVSPRLDIKFSEISKIELTAKTTSNGLNMLFYRYENAYIGIDNGAWAIRQLSGFTSSLTPAQFGNGDYNTITFSWSDVTATTDDYITLVSDGGWSKEISYKQIKIWNTDGDLVYDLRPYIEKNSTTSQFVNSGVFVNCANGTNTLMSMYEVSESGKTLTLTNATYIGTNEVVANYDFEESVVPTCSLGATGTIIIDDTFYHYGSKALKLTNSITKDSVSSAEPARLGLLTFIPQVGYKYSVSLWIKTTAPEGTLSYTKSNNILFGELPALAFYSVNGSASPIKMNYTGVSDWALITISTPEITTTDEVSFYLSIPTGSTYLTYVDDIVVRAYK